MTVWRFFSFSLILHLGHVGRNNFLILLGIGVGRYTMDEKILSVHLLKLFVILSVFWLDGKIVVNVKIS